MQSARTTRGQETAAEIQSNQIQSSQIQSNLERSVAAALRTIAAVQAERSAAPVRSARLRLATIYGVTRLQRRREREGTAGTSNAGM
ncbi:hypothetical protein [Methylobacterium frigidaeris]|uniref:Uncharacterized protein n=1 Tax=Methylobacterium frigidaeris TaxID=2038277 RepID=A0AA37M4J3_9HYPH|nr:hypothetical protein [Methylobacterium frigidaeris]PIK74545.1 hypothetical protein CS379_01940 [Methylobacterium frigidaeris]GJD62663.1 hypothetical protein MPEAHAMD_2820 [Methylobacterium frigidaeris]